MNIQKGNVSYNNITYKKPRKFGSKYLSSASYDNSKIIFQLKKVSSPFGIYKENHKYKIDIIIDNEQYLNLFNTIKHHSIITLVNNYNKWFGYEEEEEEEEEDKVTYEEIQTNLYSNMKSTSEYTVLTLPIESSDNKMNIEVYNNNKERITWKDIKKDTIISLIIRYNGIRFFKTKFSNDWSINQIKLHEMDTIVDNLEKNICYIDDDSDGEALGYNSESEIELEYDEEREYINKFLDKEYRKKEEIENLQKC